MSNSFARTVAASVIAGLLVIAISRFVSVRSGPQKKPGYMV